MYRASSEDLSCPKCNRGADVNAMSPVGCLPEPLSAAAYMVRGTSLDQYVSAQCRHSGRDSIVGQQQGNPEALSAETAALVLERQYLLTEAKALFVDQLIGQLKKRLPLRTDTIEMTVDMHWAKVG